MGDFQSNGWTQFPNQTFNRPANLKPRLHSALLTLHSHAHNQTRTIQMGKARAAELWSVSVPTAKRWLIELRDLGYLVVYRSQSGSYWDENTYAVVLNPQRAQERPALVKVEAEVTQPAPVAPTPVPTPAIADPEPPQVIHTLVELLTKNDPTPRVKNEPPFNCINNSPECTNYGKDTTRAGRASVWKFPSKPEQNQKQPQPQEPRQEGFVLTAFQVAALEVMLLHGMQDTPANRRVRDAIAGAMSLNLGSDRGDLAKRLVCRMAGVWQGYLDVGWRLRCPLGMQAFFETGAWCHEDAWRYDADIRPLRTNEFWWREL